MDLSRYTLRPFQDTDYDPVANLNLAIDPLHPEPAESARRWHNVITGEPGRIMVKWVVEELPSRSIVGWGGLMHTLDTYHPRKFFCRVGVHPEHRRRGIGEALHDTVEQEALGRGAVCLWSVVRGNDPPSLRFQERHGFAPTRTKWESRLDLTQFNPSRFSDRSKVLLDRGIRITTLAAEGADRPEVLRRFYDLWTITVEDEPRMGDYFPISFDAFLETVIRGPKVLPDATFLAQLGEKYVGSSSLERDLSVPDNIEVGFTGTLPEFRGLGIASELKRVAVIYARTQKYHSVTTGNDSLNPRIWAINEKLGFRRERTWIEGERSVRPAAA